MNSRDATLVYYDPSVIILTQRINGAEKVECANAVYVSENELASARASRLTTGLIAGYSVAPASDQKTQLQGTSAAGLLLSPAQATKVNAWIRVDSEKALSFVSSSQRAKVN